MCCPYAYEGEDNMNREIVEQEQYNILIYNKSYKTVREEIACTKAHLHNMLTGYRQSNSIIVIEVTHTTKRIVTDDITKELREDGLL